MSVGEQPTLNVSNVGRSGPNGPVFYRFEISDTAAFGSLVYSATVTERTDRPSTRHDVTIKLAEKTYFWRVIATDPANAVTSAASAPSAIAVQPFSLLQATILDSPDNFAFFEETAKITTLVMGPTGISVDFTRKNGPDRWPDIYPRGSRVRFRWAPMTFHQPPPGETIGFFVVAGDVRGFDSNQKYQERSNVVLVPMPDGGGATYTFGPSGFTSSRRR